MNKNKIYFPLLLGGIGVLFSFIFLGTITIREITIIAVIVPVFWFIIVDREEKRLYRHNGQDIVNNRDMFEFIAVGLILTFIGVFLFMTTL